jgi:hypothetical protein
MVGEAGVAPDILPRGSTPRSICSPTSAESALLRLHPDDVPLVQGKLPATIFPVGDPHLTRGSFVIESASTIVEDGPEICGSSSSPRRSTAFRFRPHAEPLHRRLSRRARLPRFRAPRPRSPGACLPMTGC